MLADRSRCSRGGDAWVKELIEVILSEELLMRGEAARELICRQVKALKIEYGLCSGMNPLFAHL